MSTLAGSKHLQQLLETIVRRKSQQTLNTTSICRAYKATRAVQRARRCCRQMRREASPMCSNDLIAPPRQYQVETNTSRRRNGSDVEQDNLEQTIVDPHNIARRSIASGRSSNSEAILPAANGDVVDSTSNSPRHLLAQIKAAETAARWQNMALAC